MEPVQEIVFELIIKTIPDAVIVIDSGGRITFANRAAETIFGLSRNEIIGRTYDAPLLKIITAEGEPYPEDDLPFALVIKSGKPVDGVEHAIERPDGKRIVLSASAVPIRDGKGSIASVVISITDITKNKLLELALRENERRFRELLKEINLVALIVDARGNIIFANDFLLDLTGQNQSSVLGKSLFEIIVPEDQREKVKQLFYDSITKGKAPEHYDFEILTTELERHTISFSSVIIHDTEGNIAGIVSIGDDVTEHYKAAEEIKESRRQVLDILESITDGFYALDNDWRFTYVNRRAEELIGVKRENLLFRNFWQLISKEEVPEIYEKYHLAKQDKTPVSFEEFILRINRWLEIHVYPYESGLSVYIRDITKRKRIEEALREKNRHAQSLLRLSRKLERSQSYEEVLDAAFEEVKIIIGYQRLWVYLFTEDKKYADLITAGGLDFEIDISRLTIEGDRMLEEIAAAPNFVVVEDAWTDERVNKEIVAQLKNRTIVNVPIVLFDRHLGSVGTGTFGDEGVRVPTKSEREFLSALASHMAVSLDRVHSMIERKKAEEALQEREKKYRFLIQKVPTAIVLHDGDGRILDSNPLAQRLLGLTEEQLTGKALFDPIWRFIKEDGSVVPVSEYPVSLVLSLRQSLRDYIIGISNPLRKDIVWVLVNAEPEFDDTGKITQIIVSFIDITDRKTAETGR